MTAHRNEDRPGSFTRALFVLAVTGVGGCGHFATDDVIDQRPQTSIDETPDELRASRTADAVLNPLKSVTVELGGLTFLRISPGTFEMGAEPGAERNEYSSGEFPRHPVTITRAFLMSRCEVTVYDFQQFVAATDYVTEVEQTGTGANSLDLQTGGIAQRPSTTWRSPGFEQTSRHPVTCVSWQDATAYCQWFSQQTGRRCRLPTEAEWEYVARSRQQSQFGHGNDPYCLEGCANIRDLSFRELQPQAAAVAPWSDGFPRTAPVGSFRPNAWGVHDLHGNVGEWCQDWYTAGYYAASPQNDPTGPPSPGAPAWRAVRGGSWFNAAFSCRCSGRHDGIETAPSTTNGFRVVVELPQRPATR